MHITVWSSAKKYTNRKSKGKGHRGEQKMHILWTKIPKICTIGIFWYFFVLKTLGIWGQKFLFKCLEKLKTNAQHLQKMKQSWQNEVEEKIVQN